MLKDRANPLHPGALHADRSEPPAPCGRCGKLVDAHTMLLWSERRRLKMPADEAGGFRYEHRDHHHAVCPTCYGQLASGGEVLELRRRRGIAILLAIMLVGILVVLTMPILMPHLLAAFWQNGAGGR